MQLEAKLTAEDLDDVRKMVRSRFYWLKFLLRNWYGVVLLGFISFGTFIGLLEPKEVNWRAIGILWAIIAAIFGWSFYSVRRSEMRELADLNRALPSSYTLAPQGLKSEGPDGANAFQPWAAFNGMREGRRVVLLLMDGDKRFVMLPTARLQHTERQQFHDLLKSYVPRPA